MNAAKKIHFEDQSNFLLSSKLPDSGGLYNQHAAMSQEEIDHTSSTTLGANSSTSDSCWAARSWENTGSGGGSIDGDYSGGRIDWDIKASWDWDNAMYFSGKGSEKKGDWAAETGEVFLQNGGKENPFPVSTSSSGIPGLAATRNAETGVVCSSNQKKQPTDLQIQAFKLSGQATQGEAMSQKGLNSLDLSGIATEEKSEKRTNSSIPTQQMCDKKDSSEQQQKKLFLGLGGNWEQKEKTSSSNEGLENGKAVVGETSIGLKLGKRTYFEDTSAVASSKSPVCSSITSPSSTKKRTSAPSMQVPRCQVEGCQTDLSTAKDYHRRHKVCAMHSKAPMVMAAGLEQRFCQQCSRFHVLSEFDEGKRSCRRRLEGHNQRRRKPQPDPLIAASMAHHVSAFHDDRRIFTGLGDRHSYLQPSRSMLLPLEDPDEKFRSWSRYGHLNENSSLLVPNSDRQLLVPNQRLLMLWQNPKTTHYSSNSMNGHGLHNFIHGSSGHGAQTHTLSSSSSRSGVLSGLESAQVSQGLTPLTDSGCALSLLSSQWGSRSQDQGSIAGGVPKSNGAMEQYVVDRVPMAQHFLDGHGNQVYGVTDKLNPIVSQGHAIPIDSGSSYVSGLGNVVGNFDSHCTFSLLQANHLRGLPDVARPTIDLMQVTPSSQQQHSHHHRHHHHHHPPLQVTSAQSAASQFSDYALRYESPLFDTQQMM